MEAMKFTAQVVSQVVTNPQAKAEILNYAKPEFDGEVVAHFESLLSSELSNQQTAFGNNAGSFAELFRPSLATSSSEANLGNSDAINDILINLEEYLKDNNMALYGPYLAENHSNTDKPITVSFDPLDDTKETNIGYIFIPKAQTGRSIANTQYGTNSIMETENYELIEVHDIDDDYAYENPVLVVVPDNPRGTLPPYVPSNQNPLPMPNNGIACNDLQEDDILELYLDEFKLNGNLRSGFWNRNYIDMYVVTKDNVSFDVNGSPKVDSNVAKVWREVQVSRTDAKNHKWKNAKTLLDDNWKLDEDNIFIAFTYKKVSVTINGIDAEVKGNFENKPSEYVAKPKLSFEEKRNLLYSFPYDKCALIALYKTPGPSGKLRNGLRMQNENGDITFTYNVKWYREQ